MRNNLSLFHVFSTFAIGGPQRRFAVLANAMPAISHHIVAMDGRHEAMALLNAAVSCEPCELQATKNSTVSFDTVRRLRELLKATAPDILCTYNWGSMEAVIAHKLLWGMRRKPAHLHFEDGFGPDESASRQLGRRALARRFALRGSPVIVPSKTLERLALRQWRLHRNTVHYIPNGVDPEHYGGNRVATPGLTIGSVGIMRREKNIPFMLRLFEAVSQKTDTRLTLIGDGPEFGAITALAASSPVADRIDLPGHQENPAQSYRGFDIFLITSDTEQMPLSVLEAMASSLPVVATDVGDIKHMLGAANAPFVCAKGDIDALANALEILSGDPALRAKIGRENRAKAEQYFAKETMIAAYRDLFEQAATCGETSEK